MGERKIHNYPCDLILDKRVMPDIMYWVFS